MDSEEVQLIINIDEQKEFCDLFGIQLLSKIAEGSFGTVFKGITLADSSFCAVKVTMQNREKYSSIETSILSSLDHPNIVKFKRFCEAHSNKYIVMEYISGGTLQAFIEQRRQQKQVLSEEEVSTIMKHILLAVKAMHEKNIIHRDIKPENILLGNNEDLHELRLSDFGLSIKFQDGVPFRSYSQKCGTITFMAPEILLDKQYSKPVDIWSCGIILYMLLTEGRHPFKERQHSRDDYVRRLSSLDSQPKLNHPHFTCLSDLAKDLVSRMLNKDQSNRYTANQALKHPFISRNLAAQIPLSFEESTRVFHSQQRLSSIIKTLLIVSLFKHRQAPAKSQLNIIATPTHHSRLLSQQILSQSQGGTQGMVIPLLQISHRKNSSQISSTSSSSVLMTPDQKTQASMVTAADSSISLTSMIVVTAPLDQASEIFSPLTFRTKKQNQGGYHLLLPQKNSLAITPHGTLPSPQARQLITSSTTATSGISKSPSNQPRSNTNLLNPSKFTFPTVSETLNSLVTQTDELIAVHSSGISNSSREIGMPHPPAATTLAAISSLRKKKLNSTHAFSISSAVDLLNSHSLQQNNQISITPSNKPPLSQSQQQAAAAQIVQQVRRTVMSSENLGILPKYYSVSPSSAQAQHRTNQKPPLNTITTPGTPQGFPTQESNSQFGSNFHSKKLSSHGQRAQKVFLPHSSQQQSQQQLLHYQSSHQISYLPTQPNLESMQQSQGLHLRKSSLKLVTPTILQNQFQPMPNLALSNHNNNNNTPRRPQSIQSPRLIPKNEQIQSALLASLQTSNAATTTAAPSASNSTASTAATANFSSTRSPNFQIKFIQSPKPLKEQSSSLSQSQQQQSQTQQQQSAISLTASRRTAMVKKDYNPTDQDESVLSSSIGNALLHNKQQLNRPSSSFHSSATNSTTSVAISAAASRTDHQLQANRAMNSCSPSSNYNNVAGTRTIVSSTMSGKPKERSTRPSQFSQQALKLIDSQLDSSIQLQQQSQQQLPSSQHTLLSSPQLSVPTSVFSHSQRILTEAGKKYPQQQPTQSLMQAKRNSFQVIAKTEDSIQL